MRKYTFEDVQEKFAERGYELLETEYVNNNTPMRYVCPKHRDKGVQHISLSNFRAGKRCKYCNASKGEKDVALFLDNNNISYCAQHTFDDCRNINKLIFDFYLPYANIAIEFDGEQHYRPVNYGGMGWERATKRFNDTQRNDAIKNQYCKDHNIKLIRISYKDKDNIEQILKKELNIY